MTGNFQGVRVAAFESRRADELANLIRHFGGEPLIAPSLREVPLEENPVALAFAERLFAGEVDLLVLLTGVGTRALTKVIETEHPRQRFVEALRATTLVARGPKPVVALRELGLAPNFTVPEPNTWRELLTLLDGQYPVTGRRVFVQEYGATNPELIEGLRARGARVTAVPVYRWALPEDLTPLRIAITEIDAGRVDVALFTSAQQVRNLFAVAADAGVAEALCAAFRQVAIGSIGPTTTEAIRAAGVSVEHEVEHPKMGDLVREVARISAALIEKKRSSSECGVDTNSWRRVDARWSERTAEPWRDSVFMRACRRQPTSYTPVWLMRQAGRYQREYRELRARHPFLELCTNPALAAEVTLMAVDRLQPDAAIIFSDLLLILIPMGVGLEYAKGEGPVIHRPVRTGADVDALPEVDTAALSYVYDAVRMTRRALKPSIPLLGFAGAPFTLASYLIEGAGSRSFIHTKTLMYRDSGSWHALMEKLTRALVGYVNAQIAAGAQAVQLFDSWVGCLSPADYREFVLPHSRAVIAGVRPGTPVIHFGTDTAALLELMKEAGGDVIGLDWRVDLVEAWKRLGDVAVMGNLDPVLLFASPREIRRQTQRLLAGVGGRPGHLFNLGHGILPGTPPENVLELVDAVRELSAR